MSNDLTRLAPDSARKHSRRALVMALGASVALHAALLAFVPGFVGERQAPVRLEALEVVLRAPAETPAPPAQERAIEPAPPARARTAANPRPRLPETTAVAAQSGPRAGPGVAQPVISDFREDPVGAPVAELAGAWASVIPAPVDKAEAPEAPAAPAVVSAAYLDSPAPRYPDAARRLGQEGTVTLRVLVNADGMPARVALERSSGSPHLDGAALERVRNWRFRPARRGAAPVESWVIVPIVFRLETTS
jgi:protein TonB